VSLTNTVDDDIAAAYAGHDSAQPSAAVDADISAAFADHSAPQEPHGGLVDQFHAMGSGLYHSVVGGYKGLAALATSGDASNAADAVNAETDKTYHAPSVDLSGIKDPKIRALVEQSQQMPAATELGDIAERHGASPGVSTALAALPTALSSMVTPRGMGPPKLAPDSAQAVVNQSSAGQSMGAAAAAKNIATASPELQKAIVDASRRTGGAVNLDVLHNHWDADSHGVQLTKGQATRDPVQYSEEQNTKHPDITSRLNKQNEQMVEAIDTIRRDASPTTVHNDAIQNGQTVVDALKAHDEPVQADIREKYKALTDANGGSMPIDTGSFLSTVDAALKKQYLTKSVPAGAAELLDSLRAGEPLDFEGFEAARSRLAEAQRNGGSEGAAARIIRGQLEQMPLAPEAAKLKGLADTARSAAKARFDSLEADPAYQAAVDDASSGIKRGQPSPLADKFLDKYALGAPKANLDTMLGKLDEEGRGAVSSHTLNAVKKSAVNASGNVLPSGYNAALQKFGPKLDSLVAPETRESLDSLGRVITNAKVAPAGHYVNYSKSGVIMNAAQGAAEHAINAKTMGMYGLAKKVLTGDKFAKDALAPGAGLDHLVERP
jgi:hypothetical protein